MGWKWLLLSLCAVGFVLPVRAEEPAPIRRVAFIIGANDGGRQRVHLRFAESDARAVSNVLETLGGVPARDRFLLLNPTREEVLNGLEHVRQLLTQKPANIKRTELFVYYSGHSDEDGLMLGEERLGYGELRHTVESLPADVRVVILDSCASGAMTRVKGGIRRPPFMVDDATKVEGHAILTSSAANEAAQESDRVGGSFFTHYLISGLRGAADTSHDGRVTLNEAYQFAFNETLARTEQTASGAQHPAYDIQLSGTGDLVMTDLRGSSARLVLPADLDGRLFVRDSDGHLAAELRKTPGRPIELGLDAGTYSITLIDSNNDALGTQVTLSDGRRTELKQAQLQLLTKEWATARGNLFPDAALAFDLDHRYASVPVAVSVLPGFSTTNGAQQKIAIHFGVNLPFGHVDRVDGLQLGVLNRTTDDVRGVDVGLAGSWISRNLRGIQVAGAFNIANGNATGLQLAGVFNDAGSLYGAQIGLINIGGDVSGAQIGLINIGSHVKGAQVGLLNIADEIEGLPVGIFSYSRKGMLHLDVWASDSAPINVAIKAGGKMVYTLLAIAPIDQGFINCRCQTDTHPYGSFGVGVQIPFKGFFGAVDLSGGPEFRTVPLPVTVYDRDRQIKYERDFSGLFKARAMLGWQPYAHFGVFGGVGANAYVTPVDAAQPPSAAGWGPHLFFASSTRSVTIWPGAFIGIQL